MFEKIFYTIVGILAITIHTSFSPIVFSYVVIPNVLISVALALTLVRSFQRTWILICVIGIGADILTSQPVGVHVITLATAAYAASFLSQHFLSEHPVWWTTVMSGIVVCVSGIALLINGAVVVFAQGEFNLAAASQFMHGINSGILLQSVVSVLLFVPMYILLKKSDAFFSYYHQRIDIKRHT